MNLYEVLAPAHVSGKYVLFGLLGLLSLWVAALIGAARSALRERRHLRAFGDTVDVGSSEPYGPAIHSEDDASAVAFVLSKLEGLTRVEAEAASQHLAAGAERQLTVRLPFLQTLLNLFVVVGLLGTLLGLAEALPLIQPQDRDLRPLLLGLRSAFAPSIWGVGLSIICGLALAGYRVLVLDPLLVDLRSRMTEWVDLVSERTQARVETGAQATLDAAHDVVRFASEIRSDSAELKSAVESNIAAFRSLQEASRGIRMSLEQGASVVAQASGELSNASTAVMDVVARTREGLNEAERRRTDAVKLIERSLGAVEGVDRTIAKWEVTSKEHLDRVEGIMGDQNRSLGRVADGISKSVFALEQSAAHVADRAATLVRDELSGRATALDNTLGRLDGHVQSLRTPFENAAERLIGVGNQLVPAASRLEAQANRLSDDASRRSRAPSANADMAEVESLLQQLLCELKRNPIRRFLRFR